MVPWQQLPDLAVLGLDEVSCRRSPWWIGVDGVPAGGKQAVIGVLVGARRWWSPFAVLLTAPGAGPLVTGALWIAGSVLARKDPGTPDEPAVVPPADGSIGAAPDTTTASSTGTA